jgi:hypothetical protein
MSETRETPDPTPASLLLPKGFNNLEEMQEHVDWVSGAAVNIENFGKGLVALSPVMAAWNRDRSRVKPIVAGVVALASSAIAKETARRMQRDVWLNTYGVEAGIVKLVPNP